MADQTQNYLNDLNRGLAEAITGLRKVNVALSKLDAVEQQAEVRELRRKLLALDEEIGYGNLK